LSRAADILERYEKAYDQVKKELFGRLHDIARAQLFPEASGLKSRSKSSGSGGDGTSPGSTRSSSPTEVAAEIVPPAPKGLPQGLERHLLPGVVVDVERTR
jgi:arogenate dehydrogenase (NADP+)